MRSARKGCPPVKPPGGAQGKDGTISNGVILLRGAVMGIEGVGHMVVPGALTLRLSIEGQHGIVLIANDGKAHMLAGQRSIDIALVLADIGDETEEGVGGGFHGRLLSRS